MQITKKIIPALLFLYGIFIGLPDIAIDLFNTRLRLDDGVMMILFFCVCIRGLYQPYHFTKIQLQFLKLSSCFAVFCGLSLCVTLALDLSFDFYSPLRMLGCMLILVTLPAILSSPRLSAWLGWGILLGGCILILQIILIWQSKAPEISALTNSFRVKNALSLKTWGPNTSANYAMMFAFAMALVGHEMSGIKKVIFWAAAGTFSLIPLFTFSRAAAAGIGVAWLLFILLAHGNSPAKAIVFLLFACLAASFAISKWDLICGAVRIDLSTGEGLSDHHIRWYSGLFLTAQSPIWGYGFGQELSLFKTVFGGGSSQNTFLSVCVEGGILGLLLFAWPLVYMGRHLWKFSHGRFYDIQAVICFAFLIGFLVLGMTQSTLYWHKSQMLLLSLILVYIGRVEKRFPVIRPEITDAPKGTCQYD